MLEARLVTTLDIELKYLPSSIYNIKKNSFRMRVALFNCLGNIQFGWESLYNSSADYDSTSLYGRETRTLSQKATDKVKNLREKFYEGNLHPLTIKVCRELGQITNYNNYLKCLI